MAYHDTAPAAMPAQPQPNPSAANTVSQAGTVYRREAAQCHFAGICSRDHCTVSAVGNPANLVQLSCFHSSRRGWIEAHYDLSKWSMGWL